MVKVRMRQTVLLGPERQRLERGQEYDVSREHGEMLVPRYASYVEEPKTASSDDQDGMNLGDMTVAQLQALAESVGVTLTAKRKSDIIAELESVLGE